MATPPPPMIPLRNLRDDPERWAAALLRRGFRLDVGGLLELDRRRREAQSAAQAAEGRGRRRRAGAEASSCLRELRARLMAVPNEPAAETPPGLSRADDPIVDSGGERRAGKPHGVLLADRGWVASAGEGGARATLCLTGPAARHVEVVGRRLLAGHLARPGCEEAHTPPVVPREALIASGHLPSLADRLVPVPETTLYVAPDGEASLLFCLRERVGRGADLPRGAACLAACFRAPPAGHGRLRGGLWRPAGFTRAESLWAVRPEASRSAVEESLRWMASIAASLGLAWRIRRHCAGRLSFASRAGHSLEAWAAGASAYVEIGVVREYGTFLSERSALGRPGACGPCLISVVAFHVHRLYACLLESGLETQLDEGTTAT